MAAALAITEEILSQIIHGMENQKEILVLDSVSGTLCRSDEVKEGGIPLPPWGSAEGYKLMTRFTATLPHSKLKNELNIILKSGSGLFRRFKGTLKKHPEFEGLWHRFKQREMYKTALSWLSRYTEALTLDALGEAPDGKDESPLLDFTIQDARKDLLPLIQEWDREAVQEAWPDLPGTERASLREREREGRIPGKGEELLLTAESPTGEPIGFAWLIFWKENDEKRATLLQIFVLPAYRGLGLGSRLLENILKRAAESGADMFYFCGPPDNEVLASMLEQTGFKPLTRCWRRS